MSNKDQQKVWEERVAQWRASGLSQRAYAIEQGFPIRQVGYVVEFEWNRGEEFIGADDRQTFSPIFSLGAIAHGI